MLNKHRIVQVYIQSGNKPLYFKTVINNLRKDDTVVVEVATGLIEANFLKYVSADRLKVQPSNWVVCKKDMLQNDLKYYQLNS